jgi:hypothetical protein
VSITVKPTAESMRRLGRKELKPCFDRNRGRPETELNFKFYRQEAHKIVGIAEETAAFLGGHFQ